MRISTIYLYLPLLMYTHFSSSFSPTLLVQRKKAIRKKNFFRVSHGGATTTTFSSLTYTTNFYDGAAKESKKNPVTRMMFDSLVGDKKRKMIFCFDSIFALNREYKNRSQEIRSFVAMNEK